MPILQRSLPQHEFVLIDPTENFTPDPNLPLVIIDTVLGIDQIKIFANLDLFVQNKAVSVHDYDLFLHLQLLKKLGKLPKKMMIIGIPPNIPAKALADDVIGLLRAILKYCRGKVQMGQPEVSFLEHKSFAREIKKFNKVQDKLQECVLESKVH